MLLLVLSTLQQLHVRLQREKAFLFPLNKPSGLAVSPLNPDEEIDVKDHGAGPRAAAP